LGPEQPQLKAMSYDTGVVIGTDYICDRWTIDWFLEQIFNSRLLQKACLIMLHLL
jgi:hypothetical protein